MAASLPEAPPPGAHRKARHRVPGLPAGVRWVAHRRLPPIIALLLGCAVPVSGQEQVEAVLQGRALLGDDPLERGVVHLHRVSPDTAGVVDSTSVSTDGSFRLTLPHVLDPEARNEAFFASIRYRDVLYFGRPLSAPVDLDSVYTIRVYETTPGPPATPFPVQVRNLFIEETGGRWAATDLFQIRNEGDRTYVPADDGPVWTYPLPPGATDFEIGESDIAPDAAAFENGAIRISAPVPPGARLYVIRYTIPGPELTLPLPGSTGTLEVLIREPAPPLVATGVRQEAPIQMEEGATYRRYAGSDLFDTTVRLRAGAPPAGLAVEWIAVVLAFVLAGAGVYALRRRPPSVPVSPVPPSPRDLIVREIAKLDEEHESTVDPGAREDYGRRRAELIRELKNVR